MIQMCAIHRYLNAIRAPIDSALNLGDLVSFQVSSIQPLIIDIWKIWFSTFNNHHLNQVGLYDQCVTVRLADGRIVEQNIYPGETHCKYDHHHQKMIGDDVKEI